MRRFLRSCALATAGTLAMGTVANAQSVLLSTLGSAVTENFDTLAAVGSSSVLPFGWFFVETGTNANLLYAAGNGSSNAGDTYSFGTGTSPERAFGGINSGSLVTTIGARFANNTGATLASLAIAYTGEQWRVSDRPASAVDRLDFQYSLDANGLADGAWTDVNALDFNALINFFAGGDDLNGNLAANRTPGIGTTIAGLSIAPGATFWIRWNSFDASGSDDGLAVDDFSLTPFASTSGGGGGGGGGGEIGIPEPATWALLGSALLGLAIARRQAASRRAAVLAR